MTNFAYSAIPISSTAAGLVTGKREAFDERALRADLRSQGLIAVDVRPVSLPDAIRAALRRDRLRRADSVWFFQTLRMMLGGKVPIESAISTMRDLAPNPRLARAAADVREGLRGGSSLAEAAGKCPGLATPQHLALLRSGQESGRLDHAVGLIDQSMTTGEKTRRLLVNRMIYPVILFIAAILSVWFLSTFVIPKFAETLETLGGRIPWQTQFTLTASRTAVWVVPPLTAVMVGGWLARGTLMGPKAKRWWAGVMLRLPIVGTLVWHHQAAMVTDVVATMIEGGGDVLSGLDQAQEVVSSPVIGERLALARRRVREGGDLGEAMAECGVLPPMIAAIVRVGMRSGELTGSLRRASEACVVRQDVLTSRLLTFMEPAVIFFLATVVGWVVYSLVSGMLAMNDAASL